MASSVPLSHPSHRRVHNRLHSRRRLLHFNGVHTVSIPSECTRPDAERRGMALDWSWGSRRTRFGRCTGRLGGGALLWVGPAGQEGAIVLVGSGCCMHCFLSADYAPVVPVAVHTGAPADKPCREITGMGTDRGRTVMVSAPERAHAIPAVEQASAQALRCET